MRSRLLRILHTLANLTHPRTFRPAPRATTTLQSMPSIPFLGALFGTSASANKMTSYPDQRSPDEWRAVLSRGASHLTSETM